MEERSPRILTVPNLLTLVRLAFLPVILWVMWKGEFGWALALFVAAGVSDGLDGILARWLDQKSLVGMYLDPIADKLLLSSAFLVLAITGHVSWVVAGIVLGRDAAFLVAVGVLLLATNLREFPPSFLGKTNTVVQLAAVFLVMLEAVYARDWLRFLRGASLVLVLAMVVLSTIQYAYLTAKKLSAAGGSRGRSKSGPRRRI